MRNNYCGNATSYYLNKPRFPNFPRIKNSLKTTKILLFIKGLSSIKFFKNAEHAKANWQIFGTRFIISLLVNLKKER